MTKLLVTSVCAAVLASCVQAGDNTDATAPVGNTAPIATAPESAAPIVPAPAVNTIRHSPQSVDDAVSLYVQDNFSGAFEVNVTSIKSVDIWDFACGELTPPDESPAQNFCALLKDEEAGYKLLEFEITGHDTPYYDWFGTHGVPEDIIGD